jgi:beta-glucanase (GH16 family)
MASFNDTGAARSAAKARTKEHLMSSRCRSGRNGWGVALGLAVGISACSSAGNGSTTLSGSNIAPAAAQKILDDEFDGSKLNDEIWFWCYPYGAPDNCTNGQSGIPYREREQYRPSQLTVADGALHLVAIRRSVKPHFPWTSGMVTTGGPFENGPPRPTFAFKYGYAEMRAKLPRGHGFWPAFWLLPASGAWPPEIDIMEWQGAQPRRDFMTVHFSDKHTKDDSLQGTYDGPDLSQAYHTYGLDWKTDSLTWYVDGVTRFSVTPKQIEARGGRFPRTPMYILINLAVGGWVSPPNRHTPSPAAMTIDYVRVWDRNPTEASRPP